ncbi:MAG: DUF3014 domain-containing protein [Gemmatimonadota bacterium]
MAADIKGPRGRPILTSRRNRRSSASPPFALMGFLVIVAVGILAGWLWLRSRGSPEAVPSAAADSVTMATAEPFVLPAVGASDAVVRTLVAGVSSHPQLAGWLITDDLIRRFVEAVVDISRGSSPLPALEVLIPEEPFSVEAAGNRIFMSPMSQRRYDLLGEVFAGVDAGRAAETYRRLLPLFREAYRELGVPEGNFEEVLARAVQNLLAAEVPAGALEVRDAVGRYVYVDPRFESLTPAQKHMLRLGPANARRVQGKVREISEWLDLPRGG